MIIMFVHYTVLFMMAFKGSKRQSKPCHECQILHTQKNGSKRIFFCYFVNYWSKYRCADQNLCKSEFHYKRKILLSGFICFHIIDIVSSKIIINEKILILKLFISILWIEVIFAPCIIVYVWFARFVLKT